MRYLVALVIILVSGLLLFKPWQERSLVKRTSGTVHVAAVGQGYQLVRHGQPYYIKGASVVDMQLLRQVKERGGNSIRLYDITDAGRVLDSAHRLGLTVTLGLPMAYAGTEMDYSDEAAVARQFKQLKQEVLRYKDHPALLMWAVGNETTLFIRSRYANFFSIRKVLKAIDQVAAMVHETDPNHPTTMVLQGINDPLIRMVSFVCNDIDLLSFNAFSPLADLLGYIRTSGWKGPFLITEFGAQGYWNRPRTEWYSKVEQTSLEKAAYLRQQYLAMRAYPQHCMGSYVFLWGAKQEYTSTWFGLFAPWPRLSPTEMADVCAWAWTGKAVAPATSIASVRVDGKRDEERILLEPGKWYKATVHTTGIPSGSLRLHWEVQTDLVEYLEDSYKKQKQVVMSDSTLVLPAPQVVQAVAAQPAGKVYQLMFQAPRQEGPYRIFFYLENEHHRVSTANASFMVHHE